jgi:hypothetical protein
VQSDRKFDDSEVAGQMASIAADDFEDAASNFVG